MTRDASYVLYKSLGGNEVGAHVEGQTVYS